MQVILMDDVERVGHEGDIIVVADGYARNYLIPRGLAVQATRGALKDLERRRTAIGTREESKRERAETVAQDLAQKLVVVTARAGQGDRLHGQVTPQMIAEAVRDQLHMTIDRRDLDIAEPIRELGDYLVRAKLYKDVYAQLPISVVRDAAADEEEAQAAPQAPQAEADADTEGASEAEPETGGVAEETAGEVAAEGAAAAEAELADTVPDETVEDDRTQDS